MVVRPTDKRDVMAATASPWANDGMLCAIKRNRSPRVQGFSNLLSRLDKPLGSRHVP
ncbi:MAG: hypothetical protein M3Y93_14000 [Pseudomonadota bacterium]|nr:hypothetical protein [Pseudomonadota bacterium]